MTPIRFLSEKATGDTDVCHLYQPMKMIMVMEMMMVDDDYGNESEYPNV